MKNTKRSETRFEPEPRRRGPRAKYQPRTETRTATLSTARPKNLRPVPLRRPKIQTSRLEYNVGLNTRTPQLLCCKRPLASPAQLSETQLVGRRLASFSGLPLGQSFGQRRQHPQGVRQPRKARQPRTAPCCTPLPAAIALTRVLHPFTSHRPIARRCDK